MALTNTLARLPQFAAIVALVAGLSQFAVADESKSLPRSAPEAQGISADAILKFVEAADAKVHSMHSFMLVRHGTVVAECYWKPEAAEKPHILWSLSKSFTSTAVGLAVEEGKVDIDAKVVDLFPDDVPANPSENLKAMRVRDLLTMSTGHSTEPRIYDTDNWVEAFLAHPVEHEPGTRFVYNTPATYMQSAIVQQATGQTVRDYLQTRLFDPLGIDRPKWDASPAGISLGGFGLYLKTEDIAKFGQLYLQQGKWNGEQIVPAEWIAEATSKQVENVRDPAAVGTSDWAQGYGFQFWRCRHNAYRGDGKDGQFCVVLPEQDAVVAITAKTGDMQAELNLVWEHLLPAMRDEPLPADPAANERLAERCTDLTAKER